MKKKSPVSPTPDKYISKGRKISKMSYKKIDPCIEKDFDDEMLFVLMARDNTAPLVILEWIKLNLYTQPPAKLKEALARALEMIRTHDYINNGMGEPQPPDAIQKVGEGILKAWETQVPKNKSRGKDEEME